MAQKMYQRKSVAKVEIKATLVRSLSNCVSVSSFFLYMILISTKFYTNLMESTNKSERQEKKETWLGEKKECFSWCVLGKQSKKDKYKQSF